MIFAHQIALDLTHEQETYCRRAAGVSRFVYNWGLAEWQRQYEAGEKPTALKLKQQWNAIKYARYPWVAEVHKDANQQPFTNLGSAFQHFFRRVKAGGEDPGYPTFKKKGRHDSFYVSNDKCQIQGTRLRLPVLGWVRMRETLRFTGKVMSITVSRTAQRWYASVAVRVETTPIISENQAVIGVDLGINHLATPSIGEPVEGPKPLRRLLQALRRCNRALHRKVKGSANRAKARDCVSRLHARIAFQRKDCLHKLTTRLVQAAGAIVMEDLHVKGMVRNHALARAISDRGWGLFRQMLTYKAEAAGVELIVADRWFPSSKMCSQCGCVKDTLSLDERTFHCTDCGFICDRDLNAALNLEHYPRLVGKSTPGDIAALAGIRVCETAVDEPGTTECAQWRMF